jgi:hypothetical protein
VEEGEAVGDGVVDTVEVIVGASVGVGMNRTGVLLGGTNWGGVGLSVPWLKVGKRVTVARPPKVGVLLAIACKVWILGGGRVVPRVSVCASPSPGATPNRIAPTQ